MHKQFYFFALFISIVGIAAILRFTNLNWDDGNRIHPDEALIVNGAMKVRFFSDINPEFHDYNGLSVYVLRAVTQVVSALTHDGSYLLTPEGVTIIGRYISAFASTLTVVLIYILTLQFFRATPNSCHIFNTTTLAEKNCTRIASVRHYINRIFHSLSILLCRFLSIYGEKQVSSALGLWKTFI